VNWLDILLAILIAGSFVTGFMEGFARMSVGFVATIAAILCGLWFYGPVGTFFLPYVSSRAVASFIGFVLVFLAVLALGALLGRLLAWLFKWVGLSWLDRLLGGAFGALRGLLFAVVLVMALMAFSSSPPPRSVVRSRIAPYVIEASRMMTTLAPRELKDGFHRSYEKVKQLWSEALEKGSRKQPVEGAGSL
jgi:membrane protein required for colicin V production